MEGVGTGVGGRGVEGLVVVVVGSHLRPKRDSNSIDAIFALGIRRSPGVVKSSGWAVSRTSLR